MTARLCFSVRVRRDERRADAIACEAAGPASAPAFAALPECQRHCPSDAPPCSGHHSCEVQGLGAAGGPSVRPRAGRRPRVQELQDRRRPSSRENPPRDARQRRHRILPAPSRRPLRGAQLDRRRPGRSQRSKLQQSLGPQQHRPERRDPGRGHRCPRGVGHHHGEQRRRRGRDRYRDRLHSSGPVREHVPQRAGLQQQRDRRRRQRQGGRLLRHRHRQQRFRPHGRRPPRPRQPCGRHDRRGREQRRRGRRRQLGRPTHGVQVPECDGFRYHRRCDRLPRVCEAHEGPRGQYRCHQQQLGRRRVLPGPVRRHRGPPTARNPLHRRRRECRVRQRHEAVLSRRLLSPQYHLGGGHDADRCAGVVLELREAHRSPGGSRAGDSQYDSREHLFLAQRDLDGHAARHRGGCAAEGPGPCA